MEERHGGNDRYDSNEQRMHMHQILGQVPSRCCGEKIATWWQLNRCGGCPAGNGRQPPHRQPGPRRCPGYRPAPHMCQGQDPTVSKRPSRYERTFYATYQRDSQSHEIQDKDTSGRIQPIAWEDLEVPSPHHRIHRRSFLVRSWHTRSFPARYEFKHRRDREA